MGEILSKNPHGDYLALHSFDMPQLIYPVNTNILRCPTVYETIGIKQFFKLYIKNLISNERRNYYDLNFPKQLGYYIPENSLYLAGTPGPHKKFTVFEVDDHNHLTSFIKFGAGEKVVNLLNNEAKWLNLLNQMDSLKDFIPTLMDSNILNDEGYIKQTVLYGKNASKNHIPLIQQYLTTLWNQTSKLQSVVESSIYQYILTGLDQLEGKLDCRWQKIKKNLFEFLLSLCDRKILSTIAHRDFCPWNIKVNGKMIGVYDWEYSANNYPVLYDAIHFIIMPAATQLKLNNLNIITKLLNQSIWRDFITSYLKRTGFCIDELLIIYLSDISLLYLISNSGRYYNDVIVKQYTNLLEDLFSRYLTKC